MKKEDTHCCDGKDHPHNTSDGELASAQKLFLPHTREHIPGQQQPQSAPGHHAWCILQKKGCRGEMKEGVESKLDLRGNGKDDPPAMLLPVRRLIRNKEYQQDKRDMNGGKEARGKRRKVFRRPRAEGWHFFGGVKDKVEAWEKVKDRKRQVLVKDVFLHHLTPFSKCIPGPFLPI